MGMSPFKRGQVGLQSYGHGESGRQEALRGLVEYGEQFKGRKFQEYRRKGYTIDIAISQGVWWVVLNPPGVSSY